MTIEQDEIPQYHGRQSHSTDECTTLKSLKKAKSKVQRIQERGRENVQSIQSKHTYQEKTDECLHGKR